MNRKLKIARIAIAVTAVILFLFAVMPQYFFTASASQVKDLADVSLGPHCCCGPFPLVEIEDYDPINDSGTDKPARPPDHSQVITLPPIDREANTDKGQAEMSGGDSGSGGSGGGCSDGH